MPREPLQTVLHLRQRAVEDLQRSLVLALAAETEATRLAREAESLIEDEAHRASAPDGDDGLVEAFGRWLPTARARAAEARAAQEHQQAEVTRRRAELAAARTGLEVIETLLRERRAEAAAAEMRRVQRSLDEAAAARARLR